MLLGMVFICNFGALGGRASFCREGGGMGRGGRGGYYRNVDEMGTQDHRLNESEEQLRIPSGCSQPAAHLPSWSGPNGAGYVVTGRPRRFFFSPFSAGTTRNSRIKPIWAAQSLTLPKCKGERR